MWKVVIIDDDDKLLRGMKKIIPWETLSCEWAGEARNGMQGLELIRDVQPHLIITDIYMPVMNGLDMIKEVRKEGICARVLILSGYNEFEYARQAMRMNIDDYLSKPASPDTIKDTLLSVVKQIEKDESEQMEVYDLREKVKMYEPLVEKEWVKSVVTGTTANIANLPLTLSNLTQKWNGQQHAVIALTYDSTLKASSFYQSDWYMFRFSTKNIIIDTIKQFFDDIHYIEIHSHQTAVCLHFKSGRKEENARMLNRLKENLTEKFKAYFQMDVMLGIGHIKDNWSEMSESMKEAFSHLSRQQVNGTAQSSSVDLNPEIALISKHNEILWSNSIEDNFLLSEAIRYADKEKALNVLESMYETQKEKAFNQSKAVRCSIEMWTIMTYSLFDIGIKMDDIFDQEFNFHEQLASLDGWLSFKKYMAQIISHICEHQQWDENLKHRQLVEQMIDYIHKNLDKNITLQDIADELFISRNYLGQIFKKIVGEAFKNYLTRVRMEKAKKMIQEGNYMIYEISEKVGFINPAYFTTIFKKYTGYTPTDLITRNMSQVKDVPVQSQ